MLKDNVLLVLFFLALRLEQKTVTLPPTELANMDREREIKYTGEHVQGKAHGQGTATFENGDVYVGNWKDGKMCGRGNYMYANQSRYEGEMKDNKENGNGKITLVNGDEYEGNWENGKFSGFGEYRFKNGAVYKGSWLDGKQDGKGTYIPSKEHQTGSRATAIYVGDWRSGMPHGRGKLTRSDGTYYDGEWANGKQHGTGTAKDEHGEEYTGTWKNGDKQGQGTVKTNDTAKEKIVKYEDNEMVDEDFCDICMTERKCMAAIPCGHVFSCQRCSKSYNNNRCLIPGCEQEITNWQKIK